MNLTKKPPGGIKRKHLFINKNFQTRFILKFILILFFSGVISIGLTLFYTRNTLTSTFVDSKLMIQNTSSVIMGPVIYTTLITTLLVGLLVILVTLLVSHKIAGPMFRFEKDIDNISQGDLKSRIHIREKDQFQELAISLNTMIESLHKNLSDIQNDVHALAEKTDLPENCRGEIVQLNKKINTHFKL